MIIITLCTSLSSIGLNSCSFGGFVDVGVYTGLFLSASLIFVIFSRKKLAKSSTRSSSDLCGGHCWVCYLVVRLFMSVCIFFEFLLHSANLCLSVTFFLKLSPLFTLVNFKLCWRTSEAWINIKWTICSMFQKEIFNKVFLLICKQNQKVLQ